MNKVIWVLCWQKFEDMQSLTAKSADFTTMIV